MFLKRKPPRMSDHILVQRQDNGDWVCWGRHVTINGRQGHGPAVTYKGEDARILDMLLLREKP